MFLDRLNGTLAREVAALRQEGRANAPERVIVGYVPPSGTRGPRYRLRGSDREYLRMNSNSYLALSHHPALAEAADEACSVLGTGPGAVRFIDGTSVYHVELEERIAGFVGRPAACAFNSAYTTILGTAIALTSADTFWIGDELNHNCIIRAMRIANVPSERRAIFYHNDVADLRRHLERVPGSAERMSGRRSIKSDGSPGGTVTSRFRRRNASPRRGEPGLRPSRMLNWFSCCCSHQCHLC